MTPEEKAHQDENARIFDIKAEELVKIFTSTVDEYWKERFPEQAEDHYLKPVLWLAFFMDVQKQISYNLKKAAEK